MIKCLKSDLVFLRGQPVQKNSYFQEEIKFLRKDDSVYTKLPLHDEVNFLFYGKTVNLKNRKSNTLSSPP